MKILDVVRQELNKPRSYVTQVCWFRGILLMILLFLFEYSGQLDDERSKSFLLQLLSGIEQWKVHSNVYI